MKYWGWGEENYPMDEILVNDLLAMFKPMFGIDQYENIEPKPLESLDLRSPRIQLPAKLADFCDAAVYERARHSYGQSFRDVWRSLHGIFPNPPDYVAFPRDEGHLQEIMAWAGQEQVALVPFGGGTSVVGGVEGPNQNYPGWISVDMKHFDKVLKIDKLSRAAQIEAGIFGPALEAQLKPRGLTLRHFPQSFEYSTLGGWIATRSGGHYATQHTHIDDFVQSVRMITPEGAFESRRLPGSGAGPSEERFWIGSEGIFGIITSAWMRLQEIPKFKMTRAVKFPDFFSGAAGAQAIAQSGLNPTNARLIDPVEAFSNGLGDGQSAVLILGFESHHHQVDEWMKAALETCSTLGGSWDENRAVKKDSDEKVSAWKKAFLNAPYLRDELVKHGLIVETFETAITWDRFEEFHKTLEATARQAIKEICGAGYITCRFTHLYPDGPAPYYSIIAKGAPGKQLEQWDAIKNRVSQAIIDHGGTITHHHAVGRDHRPYYDHQRSPAFGKSLAAAKQAVDPQWIMNPGVLV